jgi:DNA (cytosine-5)-methyltransferase 1
MTAYYNDDAPYVYAWLHNLIGTGQITAGTIDPRNIKDITPDDLAGYHRCHFFAGIAGWDLALRLAGWPDNVPVWTGSCPCQPWSEAGKGLGDEDPRHLWPELYRLIRECRPPTVFGEQVEAAICRGWLDGVFADLETEGYACGAAVLGAHSVGAPHIRQRIYWVAHAPGQRLFRAERADSAGIAAGMSGKRPEPDYQEYHGRRISAEPGDVPLVDAISSGMGSGEPELRRLVRNARANQAGRIRAYGNAIVPELAAAFIQAAAEGIVQMNADGHDNHFQSPTVAEHVPATQDPVAGNVQPPTVGQIVNSSDAPIVLSFFTGAGGFDLGLEQAGFTVRLASEIDPDARETIQINRPGIPVLGDIHQYTAPQIRAAAEIGDTDIDLVAGSPPCQTFSSAGKRKALDDVRGIAILKFASLAVELHPKCIVIENVRGLLSAEAGSVLEKVLAMLKTGGYTSSFDLYDAAYFGSPQHRDRVIIIASRDGRVPYLTPTHSDRPEDGLPRWKTLGDAIGDMSGIEHHNVEFPDQRLDYFNRLTAGQNWRNLSKEDQEAALSEATLDAPGGKSGFYRRLRWDRPCPTLVSLPNMPATDLCHPEELRPLSVEEYRRLQGFPDDWQLCGGIEAQYRQLGNAVPVPLGKAVGLAIMEYMRTQGSEDPVPGFRYSRYVGTSDRDWCGVDAAKARLAEMAPKIRRISKRTRKSLLVTARNALPRAKKAGRLLMAAKMLCRKCRLPWEPWVRENCKMSDRSAQAYMRIARNWKQLRKAQRSALSSIKAVLDFLARPKANGKGSPGPNEPKEHGQPEDGEGGATAPTPPLLPVGDSEEHSAVESSNKPEAPEEPYDDSDECGEDAKDILHELNKTGRYFDALAIVVAQSEWSRSERDLLHLEVTSLMRVLNETASALAIQGGLHRSCALLITYPGDNDKHEVKDFLARMVDAARPALEWGEIQEVLNAAKFNADGAEAELL